MAKQVIKNYTFNAASRTITLTDFNISQPVRLDRLVLITDTTTNQILYNFADSSIATAAISSNNVITLSTVPGGVANGDALRIDYNTVSGDPTYDSPTLASGSATAAKQDTGNTSLASIDTKFPAKGQTTMSASTPVAIASDQSNVPANLTQLAGTAIDVNSGSKSAGTQRVVLATDQPTMTNPQPLNLSQVAGQTTLSSGVNGAQAVGGDTASGTADAGNPTKIGGVAHTAAPTAVTDGQRVNLIADKVGKQVVVGSIRDLKVAQQTTITSSTAETTIGTAVASTFLDLYGLVITNSSATGTKVTIKDSTAGTIRLVFYVPANDTRGFMLPESGGHIQAAVNNNWTATCGTSVTSIDITALFIKNI